MQIVFREHPGLPPLSWAVEVSAGGAIVHHGSRLERGRDWCVDGCWPGAFEAGLPNRNCDGFFAFSVRLKNNELWIDGPTHPLERLCVYRDGSKIFASPSIAFICALANIDLDPGYPDYFFDFLRCIYQISDNVVSTPLADGKSLQVIANRRVIIAGDLNLRIEYRPLETAFQSYSDYIAYLTGQMKALFENAASPARGQGAYGPMGTISSGYDSAALDALAQSLGLKEAVTFSRPGETDDSGEATGARLGLKVHALDRQAYLKIPGTPEAEFLALGLKGEDVVYLAAEGRFKNKLVLTGPSGGEMWDKFIFGLPSANIVCRNGAMANLTEYRWRVGFLHAPASYIGAMGVMSLREISCSKEMEPWSVGGQYDRPIPRRILEERGLPRASFGATKRGLITVSFGVCDAWLEDFLTPASLASAQAFCEAQRRSRPALARAKRFGKYAVHRVERFLGPRLQRAGILDFVPDLCDPRHRELPQLSSFLTAWAVVVVKQRYASSLKEAA